MFKRPDYTFNLVLDKIVDKIADALAKSCISYSLARCRYDYDSYNLQIEIDLYVIQILILNERKEEI